MRQRLLYSYNNWLGRGSFYMITMAQTERILTLMVL